MSVPDVFVSICIPAYKRPDNVNRLLQSIAAQTYKDFEIIITDDSPDESVKNVVKNYPALSIRYYKNFTALGTPANWNYGISLAKGEWIKIMHDDDWFNNNESLQIFVNETRENKKFIFSRYRNIFTSGEEQLPHFPSSWKNKIVHNPSLLLARNIIGPPSVTFIHHSIKEQYDINMKWRVDIDFYIRLLQKEKDYALINETLVNVGISSSQVTNFCINQPEVELPEGLSLLNKTGVEPLRDILVYDAWWRLFRNTGIKKEEQLLHYTSSQQWPPVILKMLKYQAKVPPNLLKNGFISKAVMFVSYLFNRKHLQH